MSTKYKAVLFIALLLLSVACARTSYAALKAVGPTNVAPPGDGFPFWYQDSNGLSLGQCLESNGFCLLPLAGEELGFNPALPVAFPANYPSEHFYFIADGSVGPVLYIAAIESAFDGAGDPAPNAQVTFARIRIRVNVPEPGGAYTVTHPYGINTFPNAAPGTRSINFTSDIGLAVGVFTGALNGAIGPFLRPSAAPGGAALPFVTAPDGNVYIASPATPTAVTGGQNNFVRIAGPNIGGAGINVLETTQLFLAGRVMGLSVAPKSLTFPVQKPGAVSLPQAVTVTNINTVDAVTLGPIAFAGTNNADFTVVAPDTCSNQIVAASGSCTFNVVFSSATTTPAARTATAEITATAPVGTPPASVGLSGTIDSVPPTVISTFPEAGQTVPANSTVSAIFSEPMSGPTITGNTTTFTVTGPTGTVAGNALYDAVNNTATFIPTALASDVTYTATISAAATDVAGNGLSPVKTWTFKTIPPDFVKPTIVTISPERDAIGVPTRAPITVVFSEPMHAAAINASTFMVNSGAVAAASITFDATTNTATFLPAAPLDPGTAYLVTIKGGAGGVDDLAQNTLAADETWSFVTNRIPTAVTLISPISGATAAGTSATLIWQKAVDDDGDPLTYHVEVCQSPFFNGCEHFDVASAAPAPRLNGSYFAGLGGLGIAVIGLVSFGGIRGGKRLLLLMLAVLLMSGAAMSACSGGGGDSEPGVVLPANQMSYTAGGLKAGALYYWRVEVHDGKGGDVMSEADNFRTP